MRRVLLVTRTSYLGETDADGAARALLEALARRGFVVEALCRSKLVGADGGAWVAGTPVTLGGVVAEAQGGQAGIPRHYRLAVGGVPVTLWTIPAGEDDDNRDEEAAAFLGLFDAVIARLRPDALISWGVGRLLRAAMARAGTAGVAVACVPQDLRTRDPAAFEHAAAIVVPTRFMADFYRETHGVRCTVLPLPVDGGWCRADRREPRYATFIDPTPGNGVFAFARIADELGRRRPEIPLLVVEGRGTEATVAACGLDLRALGTIAFMAPTPDPRHYWVEEGVTEVTFGPRANGFYPLRYAATGFLRIRAHVLCRMIERLGLSPCNTQWGRGFWPFFQPAILPRGDGTSLYLAEDWAFSHRLQQVGITPLADTSIRLWHYGRYAYGWEDAGADPVRYPSYVFRPKDRPTEPSG